jgi:hypothetical protein
VEAREDTGRHGACCGTSLDEGRSEDAAAEGPAGGGEADDGSDVGARGVL